VAWPDHALGQLAPKTAVRHGGSLKQCEPSLASKRIDEIDDKTINDLIACRKRAGATAATI
jgi:hypothetical protein